MDRPTCRTCPYWEPADIRPDEGEQQVGECHRLPPVFPSNDFLARQCEICDRCIWDGIFPDSYEGDWCGEHPSFPAFIASLAAEPEQTE